MSILVVDDELTNLMLLERLLENEGYDVVKAMSGEEAIELMEDPLFIEQLDVVLLDVEMPGISGIDATRLIRKRFGLDELPILIVSGRSNEEDIVDGLDAGASDYTTKPIRKTELLARVRNAVGLKQAIDARKRYEKVLQEDFDLAQKLQQSVLSANIEDDEIRIMATYIPSKKLAGDMYAWYRISQNKYGIILFDVMGHGVSSALITMGMSSILFELVHRIGDPAQVLEELNQQMSRLFPGDETEIYFTAVYLYIDLDEMKLSYANAGHPPGLLRMNDQIIPLENTGLPVGMFEDSTYSSKTIDIVSPGCVYLYTDGFMELYSKGIDEGIHAIQNLIEQQGPNIHQLIQPDQSDEADDLCLVTVEIN